MVQCSRCKTWRLINPFRCTGENNAAGAKDAAIWSREGIKTGEVKAQSRKQFQSAGGSLRDQVNVGRERSKTKKELYKKKKEKNRPTDRQIDGKRMGGKKGREETEDRENRREDRKIKKRGNWLPKIQSESGENEQAFQPQFHAIESGRSKLKTNRFPAPCWHALYLCGSSHVTRDLPAWKNTAETWCMTVVPNAIYLHKRSQPFDRRLILPGWDPWPTNCFSLLPPPTFVRVLRFLLIDLPFGPKGHELTLAPGDSSRETSSGNTGLFLGPVPLLCLFIG